jgi:SAM-dependent methyltransferase
MEIDVNVQSNWWSTFFSGPAVEMWLGAVSAEHTAAEAEYVVRQLALPAGAAVLDVPCGGGRIANALAERDLRVVGVDLSTEFLRHARAADTAGRVEWHERDMRDLPWPARFDGAVCLGNSFGYLDDEGNEAFAAALARAVKPGGRVLMDTGVIAEAVIPRFVERTWMQIKDITFLAARQYDHQQGRIESDYTFIKNGIADARSALHRIYPYREFVGLFERAGFSMVAAETVETCGSENPYAQARLATRPFSLGAPTLLMTMERSR